MRNRYSYASSLQKADQILCMCWLILTTRLLCIMWCIPSFPTKWHHSRGMYACVKWDSPPLHQNTDHIKLKCNTSLFSTYCTDLLNSVTAWGEQQPYRTILRNYQSFTRKPICGTKPRHFCPALKHGIINNLWSGWSRRKAPHLMQSLQNTVTSWTPAASFASLHSTNPFHARPIRKRNVTKLSFLQYLITFSSATTLLWRLSFLYRTRTLKWGTPYGSKADMDKLISILIL